MRDPSRVRVSGPLEAYASEFVAELARAGYSRDASACQLRLMAQLSRWLAARRLEVAGLSAAVVEEFFAARRAAGHTTLRSPRALESLLGYLRAVDALPPPAPAVASTRVEVLLEQYRRYLLVERGLTAATVRGYLDVVRPFLSGRGSAAVDVERLTAAHVSAYVVAALRFRLRGHLILGSSLEEGGPGGSSREVSARVSA